MEGGGKKLWTRKWEHKKVKYDASIHLENYDQIQD